MPAATLKTSAAQPPRSLPIGPTATASATVRGIWCPCAREKRAREAKQQSRRGPGMMPSSRRRQVKARKRLSLFTEIKTQANAFSLAHPRPFEPKSTTKNFAQRKPRPRTRSSTAFCAPRTSSRSSTDARYREKKEEGKWRMTRRESARARERGGQR